MRTKVNVLNNNAVRFKLLEHFPVEGMHLILGEDAPSNAGLVGNDKKPELGETLQPFYDLVMKLEISYLMNIALVHYKGAIPVKKQSLFHRDLAQALLNRRD